MLWSHWQAHLGIDDLRDDLEVNTWEHAAELPSDGVMDHLLRPSIHFSTDA
jgi:hypothetical protein